MLHARILLVASAMLVALGVTASAAPAAIEMDGPRYECMNSLDQTGEHTYTEYRYCISSPRNFPAYKGWAARIVHHCDFAPFNGDAACTMEYQMHDAWRWTAAGWKQTRIGEGTKVYVHPFGSHASWRWVYTADTGWLAIPVDKVVLYWKTPTGAVAME